MLCLSVVNGRVDDQEAYERGLMERGLRVRRVAGDGNCLFRSISHQLYGTEDHHMLMRHSACDYMVRSCGTRRRSDAVSGRERSCCCPCLLL